MQQDSADGALSMHCIYNRNERVRLDRYNLKKIGAHRVKGAGQDRLLAIVLTERGDKIRVITAYDLDAGQKRDYLGRRAREE
jgi:hypothetical protein